MIYKFSVHSTLDESGPEHVAKHLPDLKSWSDYYVEVPEPLTEDRLSTLRSALGHPLIERVEIGGPLASDMVQVAYKRGIVDNENDSIVGLCNMHDIPAIAAKVAKTYQSSSAVLPDVVAAETLNTSIEDLHFSEPDYASLLPIGAYAPMDTFDLRNLDDDGLVAIGKGEGRSLELDKMKAIVVIQEKSGADSVSDALLEALDARWSDHCAHTTWKSLGNLLGRLMQSSKATKNPNIVSMFHDNAGIWDFYDGYAIAFKAETHNGPSAVSAYFGQLTKIGGVLRDILGTGLGADPIGVFEYTATGLLESPSPIAGRPTPKKIALETIRAVKEYGNTFGVPMMSSRMAFHDDYRAKPFALGGSIGLIPTAQAQRGKPVAGDHAMLIGGLTGSDGIHGASASSAGANMDTTSVQIGSPLEEIKFREAIVELRDNGCIRAITDLGAAGLNSAMGEMGEGVGVWINTALVPLKTGGLPMWRILLSESQERMALAIEPDRLTDARAILKRHEVRNTVIGRFTGNDRYCVVHDRELTEENVVNFDVSVIPPANEVGFDLAYDLLAYSPETRQVPAPRQTWRIESEWPIIDAGALYDIVRQLMFDAEIYDQSFASSQYDSSVGGRTYYGPTYGDERAVPSSYWAGRPLYGSDAAVVFNTSFNPWLYEAHPVLAARQCLLSMLTGQVLAGVAVNDVCLCDNFYTPHLEPDANSWLVAMVHEIADLAEKFGTPFISGKDSSAGSVQTDEGIVSVPPAVFLSALGKVPSVERLRPERFTEAGNLLVRIGVPSSSMAGTAAARALDLEANDVDDISVETAAAFITALTHTGLDIVPSGRVIGAGGVIGAALLGILGGNFGVELSADDGDTSELLREHRVGALVEISPDALPRLAPELGAVVVGRITKRPGTLVVDGVEVLDAPLVEAWSSTFRRELA